MSTEVLNAYTWDNVLGLVARYRSSFDVVEISGTRTSSGAWGTGSVNYQAAATLERRVGDSGNLSVDLLTNNGSQEYGSGSGYKAFVQFWNDENDYVAFGLIHDPGVSPTGVTIMVEGAANGVPIGGYWRNDMPTLTGSAHNLDINWTASTIDFTIDGLTQYSMRYGNGIDMSQPSISFIAAAREQNDSVYAVFNNIDFNGIGLPSVSVPSNSPRAFIEADVSFTGSGVGYAAYLNLHDSSGNAVAFGYQSDINDRSSDGTPMLHANRVTDGVFDHRYFDLSSQNGQSQHWKLAYYENFDGTQDKAILFIDDQAVATSIVTLSDRVFFQAEVNAANNGDTVQANFDNIVIGGNWADGSAVQPNGTWNTSAFDFWGIDAQQTNQGVQGADISIGGTLSGLPEGADWDNIESINNGQYAGQPAGGIAMITEWWFGL